MRKLLEKCASWKRKMCMIRIEKEFIAIETERTGYYLRRRGNLMEQLHYGAKLHVGREDAALLSERYGAGYGTDTVYEKGEDAVSLLHLRLELSPTGKGDYRSHALEMRLADGSSVCNFSYAGAVHGKGNRSPQGMPGAYGGEESLVLNFTLPNCSKDQNKICVSLIYTVYPDCDVITRRMQIRNDSGSPVKLEKVLSYQLDLPGTGWQLTTFTGAWARERHMTQLRLDQGSQVFGSTTGVSSHYCNPFFMISQPQATEFSGEVYGFNLIYSGNHFGQVQAGPYGKTRVMAGIQPEGFSWTLQPGEGFDTPEAVLTFSEQGKNGMSRNLHRFVREHIVRGFWAKKERPVVINNWEATYFKFNQRKLISLAREAKKLGCEMFVLDDGWFGKRDSDTSGLGDYSVNRKKLPDGLEGFAGKLKMMGLEFGLWMEPEMVSPDSELYRKHPDWAVQIPGQEASLGRNQLVLDLCREEVQDYIIRQVNDTLSAADIRYIKWDMNRTVTDMYSPGLAEQGRFFHAWVLGLYRVFDEIMKANPKVLFEGCASGGNRFDLGILCYMPQIWTSDDTDAYERMKIQTGTSYGYPQSVMSAHVSASPNHQTMRTSPLESRFDVAAFGLLGYELDLTQLSFAQKKVIAAQIGYYKEHRSLFQYGTFVRLCSPFEDSDNCQWMIYSEDSDEALVFEGIGRIAPNSETLPIRLRALKPEQKYQVSLRQEMIDIRALGSLVNQVLPVKVNSDGMLVHVVSGMYMMPAEKEELCAYGDLLMKAGFRPKQRFSGSGYNDQVRMMPDYSARIWYIKKLSR